MLGEDAWAFLASHVRNAANDTRPEDAEARRIRADMIRARMRGSPSWDQLEAYAKAMHCFTDHTCVPDRWCWASLERGAAITDPLTLGKHVATGRVYVCRVSGKVHVCDGTDCYAYSRIEPNGCSVCWVSGIDIGPSVAATISTASRKQISDANAATAAPSAPRAAGKRKAPCAPPPKRGTVKIPGKRFSQGSIAEEMQRALPEERVQYGRKLVEFAIGLVSEDSRRAAADWCHFLTYTAPKSTWKASLANAYNKADSMAQRYTNIVVNSPGKIDPIGFRCSIFTIFEAHFADQVARAEWLAFSSSCNRQAEAYFSEAMILLWKLAECTPACCEQQAVPGGPTRKKQRARSHLRNVACALLYLLSKGYSEKVRYDRITRLLLNESEAARTNPDRVVTERVVFIPPNEYLAACLPSPQHLNSASLSFESVICGSSSIRTATGANERQAAAGFDPDLMSNMAWAKESLRSLTNVRPAITIEALREYQLKNYIELRDTCQATGKFVPVT